MNWPVFFTRLGSAIVFAIIMMFGLLYSHPMAIIGLALLIQFLCIREFMALVGKIFPDAHFRLAYRPYPGFRCGRCAYRPATEHYSGLFCPSHDPSCHYPADDHTAEKNSDDCGLQLAGCLTVYLPAYGLPDHLKGRGGQFPFCYSFWRLS